MPFKWNFYVAICAYQWAFVNDLLISETASLGHANRKVARR
jgi:hypothetical protein